MRQAASPIVKEDRSASAEFLAMAEQALEAGDADLVSDAELRAVLTAAAKLFSLKVRTTGREPAPFVADAVNATETVNTVCAMLRAADLNMLDLSMWYHRPIEPAEETEQRA